MRRILVIAIVFVGSFIFTADVRSQPKNSDAPDPEPAAKALDFAEVMPGVPATTALLYGAFPGFECFPPMGKHMQDEYQALERLSRRFDPGLPAESAAASQLAAFPDELIKNLRSADRKDRCKALKCLSQYAGIVRSTAWEYGDYGDDVVPVAFGKYAQSIGQSLKTLLPTANGEERLHIEAVLLMLEPAHAGALAAFTRELRSADQERRKTACELAGGLRLAQTEVVAELAETVKVPKDSETRRAAAASLAQIGPRAAAAIPALIEFARSGDEANEKPVLSLSVSQKYPMNNVALRALREMGAAARPALPNLQEMLQTASDAECHDLIDCLVHIGSAAKSTVPTIRRRFKSDDVAVRQVAAAAVLCFEPDDDQAARILADDLRSESRETKKSALEAVSRLGPRAKSLVRPMLALLSDKECGPYAALALGALGPAAEEAIPALAELLTNDKVDFRAHQAAARGLRGIGKASIPALVKVLDDSPSPYGVRFQKLASICGDVGKDSFVSDLVRILPIIPMLTKMFVNDAYWYPECASDVACALGDLGQDAAPAVPALVRMLELDGSDLFAAAALGRLKRTAAPARAALLRAVQRRNNYIAAWALTQLDR